MIEQLLTPRLVDALGWTLVHTLWQGALFALLLGLTFILLRAFSPRARYYVACGFLGAFLLTVGLTFHGIYATVTPAGANPSTSPVAADAQPRIADSAGAGRMTPAGNAGAGSTPVAAPSPLRGFLASGRTYFDRHLPLIVTLWLMGVLVLQLRLLGQLAWVQRVKTYGTERFPAGWAERIQELERKLDVRRPVRYLTTSRVGGPFTAGWLRPVVLFPGDLLSELRESQVMTILAHELAHIKRQDFAVNVLQTFLTTLFFYHPGVWWMSGRIEDEREHCCDDLAIGAIGERVDYARTLVQLQERELNTPALSMAFGGGGFSGRVRRLLNGYLGAATFSEGVVTTLIFGAVLSLAIGTTGNLQASGLEPISTPETKISAPAPSAPILSTDRDRLAHDLNQLSDDYQVMMNQESLGPRSEVGADAFSLLMHAIYDGDYDMVQYLLERVDDLSRTDDRGFTPLMAAAGENHVEICRLLIARGAGVNQIEGQWTALIEAADEGSLEVAELLLDAGANVNINVGPGRSAAAQAASEGHLEVLKLLVFRGADLGVGGGRVAPLHLAANEGQLEIVRYLLGQDVVIDLPDAHGLTALVYAVSEQQTEVAKLLLEAGADPGKMEEYGHSVIRYGADELAAEDIRSATLKSGAAAVERLMRTPEILLGPAGEGILLTVEAMLEMGIDVNIEDGKGNTALSLAAAGGHVEVAKLLLAKGARVAGSGRNCSPLYYASREGHVEMIELLVRAGAAHSATCATHWTYRGGTQAEVYAYQAITPLMVAIRQEQFPAVEKLLGLGSDPNVSTTLTRYDYPGPLSQEEAERELESGSHGEESVRYRFRNWTPLMEAVQTGSVIPVQLLLAAGADPGQVNSDGLTARELAREAGHDDIVRLLK